VLSVSQFDRCCRKRGWGAERTV